MTIASILSRQANDLALVIGNGINRYGSVGIVNAWDDLLLRLSRKHGIAGGVEIPDGISLTEFYDLLDLGTSFSRLTEKSLQEEFCSGMDHWQVSPHHEHIVRWAQANAIPILTTNFDTVLARAGHCRLLPEQRPVPFTDFYPWNRYYGDVALERPDMGFGIWHINGMQKYRRSIRLGLSHYMGSVERVRGWIHKGPQGGLFASRGPHLWPGASTWLHIIFHKSLFFLGLGLEENEIFLRWLLIERAKYFNTFPDRRKAGWYIYASDAEKQGKLFFLERLGIVPVKARSYDEVYASDAWNQ